MGVLAVGAALLVAASPADAATCFGERARVAKPTGKINLKHGQAVVLANRSRIKVNAAGANLICAKGGAVDLRLGGGGSSKVRLGPGDDRVLLVGKIRKKERRAIWTGLGNDEVNVTGRGHTVTYLSPKKVKRGARDTDTYSGNEDIDTVYDYGGGTDEQPNVIRGNRALDYLHSAGTARSDIHGGDGTDFLYAASRGDGRDRLFGDRGNDRLNAKGGGKKSNGTYMDGAEGDDWYYGSSGPDTMVALSGVKKLYGGAGNDRIIRSPIGSVTIHGQAGRDMLSYMGQVPPGWRPRSSGAYIELGTWRGRPGGHANASNKGEDPMITSIEHVIGSAFDDVIIGMKGKIRLEGGPGDDQISGYPGNTGDGGLGQNYCYGPWLLKKEDWNRCGWGPWEIPEPGQVVVDLGADGVPVVLGSDQADEILLSFDPERSVFRVKTESAVFQGGGCDAGGTEHIYECPIKPGMMSVAMVWAGHGDDDVTLADIPEEMNVIVDGSDGIDRVTGSSGREVTFNMETGNLGRGNDQIWMSEDSTLNAGPGSDTVHMTEICIGGNVKGGPGIRDGIVFAGLKRGVWASMAARKARWMEGPCAKPFRFADDWEGLEGTREDDVLIGSKTKGITFLGRDGVDVFNSRNGKYDKITVGGEGKKNKVIADKKDKILWDWGYAAF